MIKHIVCHKIRLEEDAKRCAELLNGLFGKVPTLRAMQAGVDVLKSSRSYELGIVAEFDDLNGLSEYDNHPLHQETRKYIASVKDETYPSVACDFYFER
ncbi:MAG: Dabb family protein [Clostridia bacterium]